jgi:phosphoglycolate phosphatase
MSFDTVLFDLDGTLTDPGVGITNAVMHALRKYGIEVSDRRQLYSFIGPPLTESFMRYLGVSAEEGARAVAYYREYYADQGIFENVVYDGIPELLQSLTSAGKRLLVATSKPEVFAVRILEHYGLAPYFHKIAGSNLDGTRVIKAEVIRYALENCPDADLSRTVMVGDREHDILGAKETGLRSVGVLFGYGSREELERAGADFIAEKVEDIGKIIKA